MVRLISLCLNQYRNIYKKVKNPTVTDEEFLWLVTQYSLQFPDIKAEDVVKNVKSQWSGIRPLVYDAGYDEGQTVDTKAFARSHKIEVSKSGNSNIFILGLISVMGGKWTIYR